MYKKVLEMEHLPVCRGFVRETWREGFSTGDSETHVREVFERGAYLSLQKLREGNLEGQRPY
jgi:hypothetical protein